MPPLIRAYIIQVVIGFGVAALFVAMLLYLDVNGLWTLVSASDDGVLAIGLLWFFNGLVFGSIQFGIWVMGQADSTPPSGGIKQWLRMPAAQGAKIRAKQDTEHVRRP